MLDKGNLEGMYEVCVCSIDRWTRIRTWLGSFSVHSGMQMNECMYEYPDIMQGGGEGGGVAFLPVPLY